MLTLFLQNTINSIYSKMQKKRKTSFEEKERKKKKQEKKAKKQLQKQFGLVFVCTLLIVAFLASKTKNYVNVYLRTDEKITQKVIVHLFNIICIHCFSV